MPASDPPRIDTSAQPLLSICIPTYNRCNFLKVMLEALLPQVRECGGQVEVWVLDNHSTDDTGSVLLRAAEMGPFNVHRQPKNIGPNQNIVFGPSKLATGKFSWVLGDHNLLRPNALNRLVQILRSHGSYSVMYASFRCALYPQHWPVEALNGYEGAFDYTSHGSGEDCIYDQWSQVLRVESSIGTQAYAHLVRTSVWKNYWEYRKITKDFVDAHSTYPHTAMLVNTVMDLPVYFIGEPLLTIFNGAQHWSDSESVLSVYLKGLPDLYRLLQQAGSLPTETTAQILNRAVLPNCQRALKRSLETAGVFATSARFLPDLWKNKFLFSTLASLLLEGVNSRYEKICRFISQHMTGRAKSIVRQILRRRWLKSKKLNCQDGDLS